jgi:serine/threonine-protein kinase RsbW
METPPNTPTSSAHIESKAFPSSVEAVGDLLAWCLELRPASVSEELWTQGQTALMEAFTNAVRHAHAALTPPPPVIVRFELSPEALEFRVEDDGPPFSLEDHWLATEPQAVDESGMPLREAHWGLLMLDRLRQRFGWSIAYQRREGGGNVLCLGHDLAAATMEPGTDQRG